MVFRVLDTMKAAKLTSSYLGHFGDGGVPRASRLLPIVTGLVLLGQALSSFSQPADGQRAPGGPPTGGPGFGGPPGGFGPGGPPPGDFLMGGGPGRGGPHGMGQEIKLVEKFDKNGDKRLDAAERKAARESLGEQSEGRRGGMRGFGPGGPRGRGGAQPEAGVKLSPSQVKKYPDAPLYDPHVLRTLFLDFENGDWEKELEDFKNTDVKVPARLTVDGKVYQEVGVHFRGMSSYMMVGEGSKRSLGLSLDHAHKNQDLRGYRTLHLLNAHGDPTFIRSVLFHQIAREYIPAPKANLVRVVINGENWGVYANVQHFNKEFTRDFFGTTKGARWKVPGSPGGQGSLAYTGDDPAQYKRVYEIKSKDEPKAWADLIRLCKVLNETPAEQLEQALAPMLNIDGALRFLALDIALINNDGYWIRTSDYSIYQDAEGLFHLLPCDANETFASPGGPGFGGPGGGPGRFGPGMFLAPQMVSQADVNKDRKVSKAELTAMADAWFQKMDPTNAGKLNQEELSAKLSDVLAAGGPPGGPGGFGPRMRGGPGGFGPGQFVGPALFTAADADKDSSLTRAEWKGLFEKWFVDWDAENSGSLDEEKLRAGLNGALPPPDFAGMRGGPEGNPGAPGGGRGRGFGGGPRVDGVKLDPLMGAEDPNKPLISKLLSVPSLRSKYLGYVRDIADKWLDWERLGPVVKEYHALIAEDVRMDTRKLDSFENFEQGLLGKSDPGSAGGRHISLRDFADQRRSYLLSTVPAAQKGK
jgi:spore coat protein CotH